jgi:hypothetical protein
VTIVSKRVFAIGMITRLTESTFHEELAARVTTARQAVVRN